MTENLQRKALVATICAVAATMASLIVGISEWVGAPFPGFLVLDNGVVASAGLAHWPAISEGSIFQAKILAYDGIAYADPKTYNEHVASKPVGSPVKYIFETGNEQFERTIETRRFQSSDAFLLFGVTLFSAVALLSVSLALMYIAPKDPASIGCAIALAITGLFALTAVDLYGPYRFFRIHAFAESFLGAGGIHMSLVFPHQRRIYRDHSWIIFAAYAASASIGVLNQILLYHPAGYTFTHLLAMAWAGTAFSIMAFSQIEAFFRPANYEARQRVGMLAIGTFASITPAVLVAVGSSITGGEAPENIISWTGAFFPLAVGYAVLKSDLLEVDAVLRRTVNYVLLTIVVASVYTAFLTITEWIVRDSSNTSRTVSTIVFAALFSFAILPVRDRVQSWVDRIFFRSAYDFRLTIEDASNRLARLIELDRIRDRITTTIRDTLNPETIELSIIPEHQNDGSRTIDIQIGNAEPIDLESGGLEVRFQSRDRVVGRLILGRKMSGRFYSGLDRGLLKVLANQGSIAIENALAVDRLQELNRTLEIRVTERTAELASALEVLTSTQAQLLQAERLAAVGELAAGVAHEVNNPLNFARNSLRALQSLVAELVEYVQAINTLDPKNEINFRSKLQDLLSRRTPTDVNELAEDIKQLAEILGSGLDRTARLVQDLRDFSTPKRASRTPYSFSNLVAEAIDLTGSTIRERGIEIQFATIPHEPILIGDAQAIAQVILNILKNSVDALEGRTAGRIEINMSMRPFPNSLVVEFQDSGPGVNETDLQHLFEPFFSTKAAGKGTGLGLALCKRVVQEHHGEIQITSGPNGGATVRLTLPIEDQDENLGAFGQSR